MTDTDLEGAVRQLAESATKPVGAGRAQARLLVDGSVHPISEEPTDELPVTVPVEKPWRLSRPEPAVGGLKGPGQLADRFRS